MVQKEINTSPPVPLYYQIKEHLKGQMVSGELKTGDKIPTEEKICESFNVSRMTARRALDELVNEGRLIRRQGVGTFVAEPIIDRQLSRLTTLTEELKELGYTGLNSRILSWRTHKALSPLANRLDINVGDPILRIRRVRYTGTLPIAVQTIILPEKWVPGLQPNDIGGSSIYELIEKKLNKRLDWAKQQIDAVAAPNYYAKWLEIEPKSPLFKVTRQAYLEGGEPMDIAVTYYRPDRYSYQINLYR
ncbi:GntR family transcriptional regulator [Halalkalibacter alkaliphilus]|uniref:GntR family transcriptional regulator n=1 Tax=Halalkalibacter alkaliphilus TaxID=2917993 RepID=A0A9X2I6E2_9BACI|nr:GntR family transcriptional regulator [Halalkalibacter alkaliphilus]